MSTPTKTSVLKTPPAIPALKRTRYPWIELKAPGAAFKIFRVPGEEYSRTANRVRASALSRSRRDGREYLVAKAEDGSYYCWRTK